VSPLRNLPFAAEILPLREIIIGCSEGIPPWTYTIHILDIIKKGRPRGRPKYLSEFLSDWKSCVCGVGDMLAALADAKQQVQQRYITREDTRKKVTDSCEC